MKKAISNIGFLFGVILCFLIIGISSNILISLRDKQAIEGKNSYSLTEDIPFINKLTPIFDTIAIGLNTNEDFTVLLITLSTLMGIIALYAVLVHG